MIVMKIGGAVLKSPDGFFRMASIINESHKPAVVVISALAKTTRWLSDAALAAEELNKDEYKSALNDIIDFHSNLAGKILKSNALPECLVFYEKVYNEILGYLESIHITNELTPRTLDIILSFGEYLALKTINLFLKDQGVSALPLDATEIIVTDNHFGNAKPIVPETRKNIEAKLIPILDKNRVVIVPGFIAQSVDGETTTMGMESSNLTATLLAELLDVNTLTIWTDVEGFKSADPKIIPNAVNLPQMSYLQAMKAAVNGLKLLHPEMIAHAMKKNIELVYRSALKPGGTFSIINSKTTANEPVLILKENVNYSIVRFVSSEDAKSTRKIIEEALGDSILSISRTDDSLAVIHTDPKFSELEFPGFSHSGARNTIVFDNYSLLTLMNISLNHSMRLAVEITDHFSGEGQVIFISSGAEKDTMKLLIHSGAGRDVLKRLHEMIYK